MHRLLGAELSAEEFVGPIGDHLCWVHFGLGPGAGLPYHQRKMIVELALDHLARRADDGAGATLVDQPEFAIGFGGGQLDDGQRTNDFDRHAVVADPEILPGTLSLSAPIAI